MRARIADGRSRRSAQREIRRRARTLFSAVHGIVAPGLKQKRVEMPALEIEMELEAFVRIFVAGTRKAD